MSVPAPASLPREILRWIQSLDLSYSVKNAKRDFANGFLVAEIFSRYYEQDIAMHSYSNGTSLDNKRDNWGLLLKFFKKRGVQPGGADIAQEEINDIMQAKAGAINAFLAKVFTFLTGKKVHAPTVRPSDDVQPAFAKSTAAHAIRETMRDPGVEAIQDIATKEARMKDALMQHKVSLAEEKLKDPSRYAGARRGPKVVKGATRTVGQEESVGAVEIKQVAVKSVDSSVANLRAAKELQASRSTLSMGGPSILLDLDGSGLQPVLEVLNTAIRASLGDKANEMDPGLGPALGLVDRLSSPSRPGVPVPLYVDALRSLNKFAVISACGDAGVASPKEFYSLIALFQPLLASTVEPSPALGPTLDFLIAVGKHTAAKDPNLSGKLFRDFALPCLAPVLLSTPTRRQPILRLLYAFAPTTPAGHLQAIRTLQLGLNNMPVFCHCLSILVFLEDAFNDDILDLYVYYCVIGMRSTSPALRAASVAMVSVFAAHNMDVVLSSVDQLLSLRDDSWWEVKAQLLIVFTTILDKLDPLEAEEGAAATAILEACVSLLGPSSPSPALRVGVAYTAPLLKKFGRELLPAFVGALLRVPADSRKCLLDPSGPPDELPVVGLSGGKYRLPFVSTVWPTDDVLSALVENITSNALARLEAEHYQVLSALFRPGAGTSASEVNEAFSTLQRYLFVGLIDPICAPFAAVTVASLLGGPVGVRVFSSPDFQGTLMLLHGYGGTDPADPECFTTLIRLLTDSTGRSAAAKSAVTAALAQLKSGLGDGFAASPLLPLARSLGV